MNKVSQWIFGIFSALVVFSSAHATDGTHVGGGDRDVLFRAAEADFDNRLVKIQEWLYATNGTKLVLNPGEHGTMMNLFLGGGQFIEDGTPEMIAKINKGLGKPKVVFSDEDLKLDEGGVLVPKACLNFAQ